MINQQLLQTTKWVQDRDAKACKKCQNPFKAIFRRKHHCRNCGQLFCDNCSNYFMDKNNFKNYQEIKKNKVRLCQNCYDDINKKLRENGEMVEDKNSLSVLDSQQMRRHSKSFNVINEKLPESAKQSSPPPTLQLVPQVTIDPQPLSQTYKPQIPDTITIGDDIEQQQKKLEERMMFKIEEFVDRRTLSYGIKENWQGTMLQFILNALEYLKQAESIVSDITPLKQKILSIKIKIIPFFNKAATQYFRGITITKNIAHKRMKTHHKSPSFLLLAGSLDLDIQNFDNVVKNQHKYIQQALEQIDMLKPNIILIEKGINNILLNEFLKRDITVSFQCSLNQLKKVENAVKARMQRAADVFNKCCDRDCMGKSDTALYISCDPDSIKQNSTLYSRLDENDKALLEARLEKKKTKNQDNTLLFIHTPQYATSFQITLSGPRITELNDVKICFQELCFFSYSMFLELQMILLDQKLKQDLEQKYKQIDSQKSPMMNSGEISDFSVYSMTEHETLEIKVCKVRFHPAVISTIHDIQKRNNDESLENYIKQNIKNINNKKIPYFSQFCNFTKEVVTFYHKGDFSLGNYIIGKATDFTKYCSIKQIHHVSIRYGPGAFVRCVVERKKQQNLQVKASVNLTKEYMKKESSFLQMQSLNDETSTQCDTVIGDSDYKVQQQMNTNIITYIKCLNVNCDKQLTKSYKLERSHLEFSFYKLIQYHIMSALKWKKLNKTNWLVFEGELNEQGDQFDGCNHSQTERVFECNDFQVKLFTNLFDIYRIKHFQFNCQEVKQHIEKCDKEEIDKRKDTLISHLQKLQQQILKNDKSLRNSCATASTSSCEKDYSQSFLPENTITLTLIGNFMERLTQSPFPDFLLLEQESMQLYSRISQIDAPDQLRISKIKNEFSFSKQKTTQFQMIPSEIGSSNKYPARKTLKENTITTSTSNENLFPLQQLSIQQFTQSPESSVQENFNQFEEQSEAGFEKQYENDQNPFKSALLSWPKLAINFDQSYMQIKSFFEYIPIYNQNDIGLVASALNHPKYYDLYENKFRFTEFWEKIQDQSLQKEVEMEAAKILKEQSKQATIEEFSIKLSKFATMIKKTSLNNLQEVDEDELTVIQTSAESPRRQSKSFTIQLYYPKQFECFRMLSGINIKQFIKSIASCSNWNSAGGKSGSTFYKSADNLYIFKAVKESEFSMFESFAPKYFEHLYTSIFDQKPSVLNKIYGMFTIKNSKGTSYLIAMENLFWGMEGELTVYDLKGSEAKRWNRKNLKTLLDTNYIIDRNGEPLPIQEQDFNFLEIALESDSQFLLEVEVVDYSLLLIIDNQNQQIKLSIIDYLQCYDFMKKMETKLKTAINFGARPTIIKPAVYKDRFINAMKQYFMGIYSSL